MNIAREHEIEEMSMKGTCTLKYDFDTGFWLAVYDPCPEVYAHGDTPEDAVKTLEEEANRHDLWRR
jgi:predicted RNase H-like HicB family nuclease